MIENRIIVTLASRWDYDPTSKHQIMKILARRNHIVWINYHGTRRPTLGRHDIAAACGALRRAARGARRVTPSIVELTPLVIPGARHGLLRSLTHRMLVAQIRRAIQQIEGHERMPVQVWSFAPDVPDLVGALGEECFVYYCVDEYSEFEGFDREHMVACERRILQRADLVVTTSQQLFDKKRAVRPDAALVRHGVDFDHFAAARQRAWSRPPELREIRGPVFGFFGLIHNWVDLPLLAQVAALRPDYTFVLIGDCKIDDACVRSQSNVKMIGHRSFDELPAYCAHFDAALMLFTQCRMTQNVNPIKMYEYLAAGLPIVSTPLPEASRFHASILFGDTPRQFARACDQALRLKQARSGARISEAVADESWSRKVEELSQLVMQRVGTTSPPKSLARTECLPIHDADSAASPQNAARHAKREPATP